MWQFPLSTEITLTQTCPKSVNTSPYFVSLVSFSSLSYWLLAIAIGTMDPATSMVAGAALSAIFQRLLDTLASPFLESLGLPFGVEKEAKRLKSTHTRIEKILTDAEERQIKEESVRLWLSDLKHVGYDAEDILDELECRAKIEEAPIQTRKRKLTDRFRVTHFFSRFSSKFELGSRIKKIRESLDEIDRENNQFHFRLKVIYGPRSEMLRMRPPTSSIVDESIVFGREADREKVVRLLASVDSSASDSGIQVVPICGMGGLGKTTLAQLIHNDERVKKHFDVSAWVYVSEDFDLIRLTKAIAESVPRSDPRLTNLDTIQVSIQKALKGKKFLLVLDDVWNENYNKWDALRALLMVVGRGSRILVTTRSHKVSSMMGTVPTYSLQCLSDDDCWSIFKRLAFVEGDSDVHPELVMIGKEIIKKCNGLPLAVKTLGGLLRSKVNVVKWKSILESGIWDSVEEGNDILPALRLSYDQLPAHLKRCFEFCSIVPKGSDVTSRTFVRLWMALGFIQSKGSKDMEDVGEEYLSDLVSRSLLDEEFDEDESESFYGMHDLIHDLARSFSGVEIFKIGDWKSHHKNAEKVRHVSCDLSEFEESFNFEYLYCFKSLRTLILQGYYSFSVLTIPPDLFVYLTHIRILDLKGNHITELPESIGNLIQLRYLDLSETPIERLPKSITRLYNLQTLRLLECQELVEVPSDFSNLVHLRNINVEGCSACIPFGGLKSLRNLDHFKMGREKGYRVKELRDMIHLEGPICMSKLENVDSVGDAKEAELKNKQKINCLELEWESHDVDSRQEGIEEEVLNALQPHTNLEHLKIKGYCGVRFPTWLGDSSFSKLVSISLIKCKCPLLPPFGQLPSLKDLSLENLYGLEKVGREVYGDGMVKGFPSLKTLAFRSMPDLEEWTALEGDMIHVSKIDIWNCSKLRVLPRVPTIRHLSLSSCDEQILRSLQHLTSLSSLYISGFPTLTTLPNGLLQPLTPLEDLIIYDCDQLISLSEEVGLQHLTSLQSLRIWRCPQLTSLGDEVLPATLHHLEFSDCGNLNRLPTGLQNVTSLIKLELASCPKIPSLPEELPTTLQRLGISNCSNLDCLPTGLRNLTSLVELVLASCPKIPSLPEELPTTLQRLNISDCSNLDCLPTGLKNVTSLVNLVLKSCPKIPSLPEELPTTLQCLDISECSNLDCLPTGLRNLTSLANLVLKSCPKIHFLPEELPTSTLDRLVISFCPLVTEKCKVGGEYWSKISHIPNIQIDFSFQKYKKGQVMR